MNRDDSRAALIVIDLENGFISEGSPHRISMAADTLPACSEVINASRKNGIPVFFVKRIYRQNGSDVELTRWRSWKDGGRSIAPSSTGINSAEAPQTVRPEPGDYTIIKPRWSAFFQTELDLILRRLGVKTVVLIGTTTPNCIRTTAYDANALDYEVIIIEDCCSSQTKEIQKANIGDLERMGAIITHSTEYLKILPDLPCGGWVEKIRQDIRDNDIDPEPISEKGKNNVGWLDRW